MCARYTWQIDLEKKEKPEGKIIKILIYDVKSSVSQAMRGLKEIAKLSAKEYSLINQIVQNDIYDNDCLSGENTEELVLEKTDQFELIQDRDDFSLKVLIICLLMIAVLTWQG